MGYSVIRYPSMTIKLVFGRDGEIKEMGLAGNGKRCPLLWCRFGSSME